MRSLISPVTRIEAGCVDVADAGACSPSALVPRVTAGPLLRSLIDYIGISLLIMLPLWRPGYVLTMDAVFVPHYRFTLASDPHDQALSTLLAVASLVLPGDIIEKLAFTAIFVLAGLGMHRLVAVESTIVRYVAGLLAVFNPFVYDRLMYGQWSVLLGYALLPWLLSSLRGALAVPGDWPVWPALRVAGWWTIITLVALPMGLIAAAAMAIVLLCDVFIAPRSSRARVVRLAPLIAGWGALLNAYWIAAEIAVPSAGADRAVQFLPIELSAFATQGDPRWGSVLTILGGYGFWAEGSTRFIDMREVLPYWPVEPIAVLLLGAVAVWVDLRRRERSLTLALIIALLVALLLGIGLASPISASITRFLFDHVALYRGLRDTQKWTALVIVAEIALVAKGLDSVVKRVAAARPRTAATLGALCLLLPVLFAPALFWGCAGQLQPAEYPASWFSANQILRADPRPGVTLFLPWHEYLRFPFAGRVIANPAQSFFDVPVVQGDNMEMRIVASDSVNPVSTAISRVLLSARRDAPRLAGKLAQRHIKYILLARAADWRQYQYLRRAPQIRLRGTWADMSLYQNLAWRG